MPKILFICHGNICRSPMAEFVMKDIVLKNGCQGNFEIASAAVSREEIGNDIHNGTRQKLISEGIHFCSRQAVQIKKSDYAYYDYIIAMDKSNLSYLNRIIGGDIEHKVSLLLDFAGEHRDIADPWYTGNFDETFEDILKGCRALFQFIQTKKQA